MGAASIYLSDCFHPDLAARCVIPLCYFRLVHHAFHRFKSIIRLNVSSIGHLHEECSIARWLPLPVIEANSRKTVSTGYFHVGGRLSPFLKSFKACSYLYYFYRN